MGKIEEITKEYPKYHPNAYFFIHEAIGFTGQVIVKEKRHITGQELCEGIKQLLRLQFGLMARTVVEYWGIKDSSDFGNIVFKMVEKDLMGRTENDKKEDFDGVFGLEAFDDYQIDMNEAIRYFNRSKTDRK